ncbi:MAG: TlpA disulfide reductase family protein [Bacteroidota bacterium]
MKPIIIITLLLIQYTYTQNTPADSIKNEQPIYFVDKELPNLQLKPLSGKPFKLNSLKGQIVVLNWWFTSCLPCKEEIPELNEIVSKYKRKGIRFIAIARNTESDLKKYLTGNVFKYEHTLTTDSIHKILDDRFPRNIIINKNGVVVFDRIGYSAMNAEYITNTINSLLKQ